MPGRLILPSGTRELTKLNPNMQYVDALDYLKWNIGSRIESYPS
jgi:hypothetical protein